MPSFNFRSSKSALDKRHLVSPVLQARRRLGYAIALGVVLCALTYFFYTAPKTSAESKANANLTTEQSLLTTVEASLRGAASGTDSACVTYHQDHALDQLLPATEPDISLGELSNLVQSTGLTVSSITPTSTAPGATTSGAMFVSYTVGTTGNYQELQAALAALDAYSPLLTVSALNTAASTVTSGDITATLTIDEWWYPGYSTFAQSPGTCK